MTACPCRCVTDTNTTLTVRGSGFVEGAVVTIDDEAAIAFVVDEGTVSVPLWISPDPGRHTLRVRQADAHSDDDVSASATFFMPE